MNEQMQQQFEQAYSEDNGGVPASFIKLQRLGDSYDIPKIARAWYWFKRSREALVIDLPPAPVEPEEPEEAIDDSHMDAYYAAVSMRNACANAIEAAGLKVTP